MTLARGMTREQFIAERMERFRSCSQCLCAAHYSKAYREAAESWDSSQKLEEWFKTPEGIAAKAEFQKTVEALVKNPEHQKEIDTKPVGDGYICQFCGKCFPAAQWNRRGQVCPSPECGQPYSALLDQDTDE